MNMGAYLLSCFSGAKNPNDRDLGDGPLLVGAMNSRELGVECSGSCLVVINAIQSNTKEVHQRSR